MIRRSARWQGRLDERVLEVLADEPWSTPGILACEVPLDATEGQIRDRCKVLADAELLALDLEDGWRVELTGLGKRYLEGETDMRLYRRPRGVGDIDREMEVEDILERSNSGGRSV
jgi:hypothetical protein